MREGFGYVLPLKERPAVARAVMSKCVSVAFSVTTSSNSAASPSCYALLRRVLVGKCFVAEVGEQSLDEAVECGSERDDFFLFVIDDDNAA